MPALALKSSPLLRELHAAKVAQGAALNRPLRFFAVMMRCLNVDDEPGNPHSLFHTGAGKRW